MKTILTALAVSSGLFLVSTANAYYYLDFFATAPLTAKPGAEVSCNVVNINGSDEHVTIRLFRVRNNTTTSKQVKIKEIALVAGAGTTLKLTNVGGEKRYWCEFEGDNDPDLAANIQTQKGANQNSESAEQRKNQ